ncbi:flagellar M-ring protein FliF [Clostridium punense]|uniref:Flagellar M-ring protein n=1 Tax=Clostridium punense TaxID=1054297 RepID=A0ABS4K1Z8_9CLOT|nr:flagellar basal-body MS-ring/collar protein FliF [Clostridium punense]MBP2021806.1 flagellar M-ring protein FliF [Clostridium punense]
MNKLSDTIKGAVTKWKELSKSKKVAYSIITTVALLVIGILIFVNVNPKYVVLFSDLNSQDSGAIIAGLDSKKVSYKVQGDSIMVPKSQVDKLRMELLSEVSLTEGSHGFELFDNGKVAPTDSEAKIMYQRALSGELERTIKSFEAVDWAKVNLVLPDNSAFVTKPSPATASVTLKLVKGKELSEEQVKAIVSLVSGSVENLPKENVTIVSDDFKLLTEGIFDKDKDNYTISSDKQLQTKKVIEDEYQRKILNVLEPIYKDGIRVSVNAKVNFDAKKQDNTIFEQGAVVSEHEINNETTTGANTSGSPVSNNMTNVQNATNGNERTTNKETTKNYEPTKKSETVVSAPGQVERVTASIVVNGQIDAQTRMSITNLVSEAIGVDQRRGDTVTVESLAFNSDAKDLAQKNLDEMKTEEANAKRNKLIALGIGGGAALIILIIILSSMRKRKSKNDMDEMADFEGIDMVIGETITPKPQESFESLNLESESQKDHVVKEVKKYAEQKPEQVADIIKSWLAEEEGR